MPHMTLTHYTNKQGYQSVYFTPIDHTEIGILGPHEFTRRTFNDVTEYAVDRLAYYITVRVDPKWNPRVAREEQTKGAIDDIWLVPGTQELDIADLILFHGQTSIGLAIEGMRNRETAARDYAYQLNEEQRAGKSKQQEMTSHSAPKRSEYVFIDGRTVKRPQGWDDDYFYAGITPGGK